MVGKRYKQARDSVTEGEELSVEKAVSIVKKKLYGKV